MLAEHPQRRHRLSILAQRFASLPRVAVVVLGLLLVLGIAYLDFTGPSKLVVSIFYLLPVMLVAWLSRSTICGLIVAAATFAADPVGNVLTDYRHSTLPLALWSGAMRFAVFCIVLALMAKVRSLLARLEEQATTDELTGLANLRAAHETMAREIERSKRFGHPLTLAYLDIDHFKEVNDRAGHAAGDRVLVGVASVARASTRAIDTVARVGGDEFVVLMPETGADTALPLVDRLREAFARAVRVEDQPLTCSIGLASFQRPPASVDEMMEAADRLMYEAKTAGGGDVCQREVRPVRSVTDRPQLASV
jgi:diguanylate cyclase (GGDEF)-like protein